MLTRRKLIMGAVATALVGLGATPALARDERLLADILYGVSDALVRDYIRDRYEDDSDEECAAFLLAACEA